MMQKTSIEIVLTREEADTYYRKIHKALDLLNDLPLETTATYEYTSLRASLLRLAGLLADAVMPLVPPPRYQSQGGPLGGAPDPFIPEGNGSAHDVLLGRLYDSQRQVLTYLQGCTVSLRQTAAWEDARRGLELAWREYEELIRG